MILLVISVLHSQLDVDVGTSAARLHEFTTVAAVCVHLEIQVCYCPAKHYV